jgi:chloride channel protein, CIC family
MNKGDFTADLRLIWIALLAVPVGAVCALVALVLQRLIGFFTNVFYYHSLAIPNHLVQPPTDMSGWTGIAFILVPVVGGLIIGLMARYGSERIRGHGIPEAMEAILIGQSRMQPRVAVLKPLSSAVSIGSGGPFGAEGPIIMTGGAFGSIIAQVFHMTAAERKTLLVAGAAGGMSATFGTPIAAVLLAVELLLFELKPRSLVPVALASAVAALVRGLLQPYPMLTLGPDPLFPVPHLHGPLDLGTLLACVPVGLLAGILSLLLTGAVYAAEDAFLHLRFHWMWWPALGGLAVGIGGYFQPHALGVGYDNIERLLQGNYSLGPLITLILVKCSIWAIALGSGTSGGVLAPLLIMGGALGALEYFAAVTFGATGGRRHPVASGEHGRRHGRHHALPPDRGPVCHRTNARHQHLPGPVDRLGDRSRFHGSGDETVDLDGKGRPARLPCQPRVFRRPSGDSQRWRRDECTGRHGARLASGSSAAGRLLSRNRGQASPGLSGRR